MSVLPHQIYRDLAGEIRGDVHVGLPVRAIYSTAACIYRIMPLAVARPRDAADTASVVRYAVERGIPITPRGGGSGVAGHSIGPGIVLDFSTYMNGVLDEGDDWIEVQPGMILDDLNAHLAGRGKRFSPDPSSSAYCTIGGMIANNSSGARGLRFGSTRRHVIALEVVNAEGRAVRADSGDQWVGRMKRGLAGIFEARRADIESHRPRVTKNSSGYELWDVGDAADPDIVRIITGSEGTLAVVTAARLTISPLPSLFGAALLHFADARTATGAVPRIRECNPTAIEIMDAEFLRIVRNGRRDLADLMPEDGRTLLLVEHEAFESDDLRERLDRTARAARAAGAERVYSIADAAGVKRLWAVRKAGSPIISSIRGAKRPLRFVEDMVVPPERLADFADMFLDTLRRYDCAAPIIGHAGDGNIHVNPLLNLNDPGLKTTIRRVADEVYDLVDRFNGSLSGEHGDGRLRAPYLEDRCGAGVYRAFEEIKSLFDPAGIFNPGVILGNGEITDNLRYGAPPARTLTALDEPEARLAAAYCHGCGDCRDDCPVFNITITEEMSPRGRVSLARAIMDGKVTIDAVRHDQTAQATIAACLGCARCEAGCSSGVDIPALMSYMKGLRPISGVENILHPLENILHPILSNPRRTFAPLSRLQTVINPLLNASHVRNIFCALSHLNPDRPLPIFNGPSLKKSASRYVTDLTYADVIYFPGCYATFVDPAGVGSAVLFIMESLGIKPRIASFGCCGLPMLAHGDRAAAGAAFSATVAELNTVPDVNIITSCPSCLKMLRTGVSHERPPADMLNRLRSAESFIADHLGPRDDLKLDMRVAIQTPCHQRGDMEAVNKLLTNIKGLSIIELPDECCGMGGTTGLMGENREMSRAVGEALLDALAKSGAEVVLSSCGACRMALSTVTKDTHPLALLAQAMGHKG